MSLGYLQCAPNNRDVTIDNGDVHENIDRRKIDFASFNFSAIIPSRPDTEKKGIYVGAEERGRRPGTEMLEFIALPFPFYTGYLRLFSRVRRGASFRRPKAEDMSGEAFRVGHF